ncbi:electron transfer flavoprotein subunit beta/FixA family protein [Mucilaginibacter gotjawali]|uniref:Electron transfer flavoprotein beta subunit n=2 Tax=Mucilaginibacter gotjawali TaxID=1550579 RepID=A0A839SB01_9SPHI|nr:electron transfer flavoprotein subunit beta/FixA family protein [Mucilaginibacter gotjawali]MBB3054140.1 electron transfer flavoprotein beta subunit [Mucilaginibacter gotjawali]BAU54411.1 Electron transfer flavoprotein subunit beta [Mucilaginibacter gotjawali]
MKILVCISNVPDTTTKITFSENNTQFNTTGVQFILNPYDEIALARAIELTEGGNGSVTVINVGEVNTEPTVRKALAIGATDAVRINAKPHDAWFVAYQVAQYVKANPFDLILTGRESIDYNGAKVGGMIAELLDLPSVSIIKKLEIEGTNVTVEREIEGGKEVLTMPLPIVAGCAEGVAEPKIPNMRGIMSARTKPLTVVEPVEIKTHSEVISYETPAPRGQVKLVPADEVAKLVGLLHEEARVI